MTRRGWFQIQPEGVLQLIFVRVSIDGYLVDLDSSARTRGIDRGGYIYLYGRVCEAKV